MTLVVNITDAISIFGVMVTHWYSSCVIGLCSPEFLEVLQPTFYSTLVMLAGTLLIAKRNMYPDFSFVGYGGLNVLLKASSAVLKMNLFFTLIWVPSMAFLEDVMGVLDWMITELNGRIGGFPVLTNLAAAFASEENAELAKAFCAFLLLFWVMNEIKSVRNARM